MYHVKENNNFIDKESLKRHDTSGACKGDCN